MSIVPEKLAEIQRLHSTYKLLTGLVVPLDSYREYQWFEFIRRGLTEDDLCAVIRSIRKGVAANTRNRGALRFTNLIGQLDRFEEDLAECRALARGPARQPARDAVLQATGRVPTSSQAAAAVSAADVVLRLSSDPAKAQAALDELRKLKGSL